MLSRGRIGGLLAGLCFMLPGFALMILLSRLYLSVNLAGTALEAASLGIQPAVIALIVRDCHRIDGHCHTNAPPWAIGVLAAVGEVLGVSLYVTLPLAGIVYVAAAQWQMSPVIAGREPHIPAGQAVTGSTGQSAPPALLASGLLRAGRLAFGGDYAPIPFLREHAV